MTDDDRTRLRALKESVSARLSALDLRRYRLWTVDSRLHAYVRAVKDSPSAHNLWEQLAVERFLRHCERYGIRTAYVQTFFRFYESLTFPGTRGATRYRLTPVQCFQFAGIFAFWEGERRVVREAVLYVPRKFSKTTSSAAFAVWDLLFGDANAESYVGANSADQAKKCFDAIRGAVRALDPGERRFVVNEQVIRSIIEGRSSRAQCLTANARTKDGLNASTVIMDEYSQARDASLLNVLTTSMGVRLNPLTIIITTASEHFDYPFYDKLAGCKAILSGDATDDSLFAHIFEPDIDDEESSPLTWRKVHPHMGVTVSEEFYRTEYQRALRDGMTSMLAFRTKLLNLYTAGGGEPWIERADLERVVRPFSPESLGADTVAMMAFDLAACDDLTAVCTAYYTPSTARFHFVTDYYFPEGALSGHTDEELFRTWAAAGHLHLTEGRTLDYRVVYDRIRAVSARVPVIMIAYDAWGVRDLANYLMAMGLERALLPVPQTYGYFSDPVFALKKLLLDGTAAIDDNPITLWCYANCYLDENSSGFKPQKRTHSGKIDGVIATLMATRAFLIWKRT